MADAGAGCGFEQVDVTLVDYAFEGVPDTLTAGPTTFAVTNESDAEMHEMVVFGRLTASPCPSPSCSSSPRRSPSRWSCSAVPPSPARETGSALVDLAPGDYAMVCFVPVGSGEEGTPTSPRG